MHAYIYIYICVYICAIMRTMYSYVPTFKRLPAGHSHDYTQEWPQLDPRYVMESDHFLVHLISGFKGYLIMWISVSRGCVNRKEYLTI